MKGCYLIADGHVSVALFYCCRMYQSFRWSIELFITSYNVCFHGYKHVVIVTHLCCCFSAFMYFCC